MKTHNAQNERVKHAYFTYLREAKGMSEASIDQTAKALNRFETYTAYRDFKQFHRKQAEAFKQHLAGQRGQRTNEPLSKATIYSTLTALKAFFVWLAGQPGYKSRISYADTEYFNMTMKDARVAKAVREPRVPTLEQIRHVLRLMPAATPIDRRNRAIVAFTILTGARDGAVASMKLKHVDLDHNLIEQDAREVRTKFSKSFATYFFPVGDDWGRTLALGSNHRTAATGWLGPRAPPPANHRAPPFLGAGASVCARSTLEHPPAGVGNPDAFDLDRLTASLDGLALCSCKPSADEAG